jgi:hypothetical protein
MTSPHDLPAPGRRQTLYFLLFEFAESCVFVKQSIPPIFCPQIQLLIVQPFTYYWATFFRSYSSNLQSSLTGVLSRALEYSSRPPVSVSGTS